MTLLKISFHADNARDILETIGELNLVELRDLRAGTSFYNRSFTDSVKECTDLSGIVTSIGSSLQTYSIEPEIWPPPNEVNDKGLPSIVPKMDSFEQTVRDLDQEMVDANVGLKALKIHVNIAKEGLYVLDMGKKVYSMAAGSLGASADLGDEELMPLGQETAAAFTSSAMHVVTGVVKTESLQALERVIWRATRGNAVFHSEPIEEELLDTEASKGEVEMVSKSFFMVFLVTSGDKVKKICSYFGATLYPFPTGGEKLFLERREAQEKELSEGIMTLNVQQDAIAGILSKAAKDYSMWVYVIAREKMIFDALNMSDYDIKRSHLTSVEGWAPTDSFEELQLALQNSEAAKGRAAPLITELTPRVLVPPTFVPTTAFSSGFQGLVNTYGTPRYREANPGAFCCILFPFLFGIMFGDLGHGVLLASMGGFLISMEKSWGDGSKLGNDMLQMMYGGRYIILLNGIFGAYVGIMYNEAFAYPMALFGPTKWGEEEPPDGDRFKVWDANGGTPYPVGVDPIWHLSDNKITFFNSLKMKISIVVGVIQMTLGILISLTNHLEFKDYKRVLFQFIPEITFFLGIFGYLVFTIFLKWATDFRAIAEPAPSLLTLLINMFMSPTAPITEPLYGAKCEMEPCEQIQTYIQNYLTIAAVIAVPILLLTIPILEIMEHSKKNKGSHAKLEEHGEEAEGEDEHEFSAGDAFIHQGIHTIEFVLGGISNTASYLRLWALSLAHSQLAELFKDMVLGDAGLKAEFVGDNMALHVFMLFLTTGMWAILSMAVLMGMENLSSFLHALRLQWVEFQNKFYHGDGRKFCPFTFTDIGTTFED